MATSSLWKPTNLHISHSWGGGLGRWIEEFVSHDVYCRNFVLSSRGTLDAYGLSLELRDGLSGNLMESWDLQDAICESAIRNIEYIAIILEIVQKYRIDHIYISCFIGHSLDLLFVDIPVTIIYHDYFPFCPALRITFSNLCTSCTSSELRLCLGENRLSTLFRQNSADYWMEYRKVYFDRLLENRDICHICPSRSVVRNLRRVDSRYKEVEFAVIEHGIRYRKKDCFGAAEESRPLRILLLGKLDSFKGLERISRLYHYLRLVADLYVVGGAEHAKHLEDCSRVTFVESYTANELPMYFSRICPDVALFLADTPETFCYTLSEVLAHCIPVCAFRMGSFEDRIVPDENGLFIDRIDDESVLRAILDLDERRQILRDIHARLKNERVRTISEMVEDYYEIRKDYRRLVSQRLGVRTPQRNRGLRLARNAS